MCRKKAKCKQCGAENQPNHKSRVDGEKHKTCK